LILRKKECNLSLTSLSAGTRVAPLFAGLKPAGLEKVFPFVVRWCIVALLVVGCLGIGNIQEVWTSLAITKLYFYHCSLEGRFCRGLVCFSCLMFVMGWLLAVSAAIN
jgi:hypothetical protein